MTWAQQNKRVFAASPIDTATPEEKQRLETRHGFAASPIDTGTPEENQRLETRHVGAPKRVSCETSFNFDTFDTLANRLECHKVPRLRRKTARQAAWKRSKRRFAASPIETELTTQRRRDDDATATRRATGGEQGSSPPRLSTGTLHYAFGKKATSRTCDLPYCSKTLQCGGCVARQFVSPPSAPEIRDT